jgi:hypothetical protein
MYFVNCNLPQRWTTRLINMFIWQCAFEQSVPHYFIQFICQHFNVLVCLLKPVSCTCCLSGTSIVQLPFTSLSNAENATDCKGLQCSYIHMQRIVKDCTARKFISKYALSLDVKPYVDCHVVCKQNNYNYEHFAHTPFH